MNAPANSRPVRRPPAAQPPRNHVKSSLKLLSAPALLAALLLLPGCSRPTLIHTQAAGHSITAEVEGSHSLESQASRAVLTGEFGRITVEPARVQLGDGPWTRIPEGVPVKMGVAKHKRWVVAGGVAVKETSR